MINKICLGTNIVSHIYLGTTDVDKHYLGSNLVYSKAEVVENTVKQVRKNARKAACIVDKI